MNDYLEWLTAGFIFLWILGAYDARAAQVDPGSVGCELTSQSASLPAPPFPGPACPHRIRPPATSPTVMIS